MIRQLTKCIALTAALVLSFVATAATPERYSVKIDAKRTDNGQTLIKIWVGEVGTDGTTTVTRPALQIKDGMRATLTAGKGKAGVADPTELESGTRVDVVGIKGTNKVIVVTSIVEKGDVIWADAKTVEATSAAPDKK